MVWLEVMNAMGVGEGGINVSATFVQRPKTVLGLGGSNICNGFTAVFLAWKERKKFMSMYFKSNCSDIFASLIDVALSLLLRMKYLYYRLHILARFLIRIF